MAAGRLIAVCLLFAAWGCHPGTRFSDWREDLTDWRADIAQAMRFEAADDETLAGLSIRVFLEERRPQFSIVRPERVARAWERKLRTLDLSPRRTDRIVKARTPQGLEFELVFWTESSANTRERDVTVGELLWSRPDAAGDGVRELLDAEKRFCELQSKIGADKRKER